MAKNYYVSGEWNFICSVCLLEKPENCFYIHSNGKPRRQCKYCRNIKSANHKKRTKAYLKYQEKNRERCRAHTRKWRINNLAYDAYRTRTYTARKLQAVPKWADLDKIEQIYFNRPEGFHVDHIVPLKGELVCGLHVDYNLQYLLAIDNIRKKNYVEDMG